MNMNKYFVSGVLLLFMLNAWAQELAIPSLTSRYEIPTTAVKSQGRTGTCWSFSTCSFFESEYIKNQKEEIDLSEMFIVRHIYLEKARKYLRLHGTSNFSQGSLAHDVLFVLENYGAVPESIYPGLNGKSVHDHSALESDLKNYLDSMLQKRPLSPQAAKGIDSILDHHLGQLPELFEFKGKLYNPSSFAKEVLQVKVGDYIPLTSFLHHPYYTSFILEVPDNFSNGTYFNVPLEELVSIIDRSLELGHSVEWDGDVSEHGFKSKLGFAVFNNQAESWEMMPDLPMDLPADEKIRQDLFDNLETTDDHLMHITGISFSNDGRKFYKTKNSWGISSGLEGYMYMSEVYLRMKTVSVIVHRSAIPEHIIEQLGR